MSEVVYHAALLPEHRGNPLIEALPPKQIIENTLRKLTHFPSYSNDERDLSAFEREEYVRRLKTFRFPLVEYEQCYKCVHRGIVDSYSSKSPLSPSTSHFLHHIEPSQTSFVPSTGIFQSNGSAMTILGVSGIGKSSMLSQILNLYDQVIPHGEYNGEKLNFKQVVWLRVDVPHDSSVKGLCEAILDAFDIVLGRPSSPRKKTISTLSIQITQQIKSNFLGALVLDEIQNLNIGKAGGADTLISFLLSLINNAGISIVLCGDPEVYELLQKKFRVARRAEAGGFIYMEPLPRSLWPWFVKAMWRFQWTNIKTRLTDELVEHLYDLSAGVVDLAIRIYRTAQEIVIGSGDERITSAVLNEACHRSCKITRDDILVDLGRYSFLSGAGRRSSTEAEAKKGFAQEADSRPEKIQSSKQKRVAGDLTRPQHPEFEDQLVQLRYETSLANKILNPRVIRDLDGRPRKLDMLKREGLLITDPLRL